MNHMEGVWLVHKSVHVMQKFTLIGYAEGS